MDDLAPYVIEPARSGRSRCKTCRRPIKKDSLRLGVRIEGPFGPGYLWHHINCAAKRQMDRLEEAYSMTCWEPGVEVPPLDSLRHLVVKAEEQRKKRQSVPYAEKAPTGRSLCKRCGEAIEKGGVRVVLLRRVEFYGQVRHGTVNVHPRCVAAELAGEDSAVETDGFADALRSHTETLEPHEIDAVLAEIGPLPVPVAQAAEEKGPDPVPEGEA
jgi:hypothetical protein